MLKGSLLHQSFVYLSGALLSVMLVACGGGKDEIVKAAPEQTHTAPVISVQPAAQSVLSGHSATFAVVASGTGTLHYQWKKNGANVGSDAASYTTPATDMANDGEKYLVEVSNAIGSVISSEATLTVSATPLPVSIQSQPQSVSVTAGATATFTVSANGTEPLHYQWMKNGVNIGGDTANYTTPATTMADNGASYAVVVSNAVNSETSTTATLTVNAATQPVSIQNQPQNISVTAGATATFTVTASGTGPLHYQWKRDGVNVGSDTSSYTTPPTDLADNGATFTVVVSNAVNSGTSTAATLTVTAAPPAPTGIFVADHTIAKDSVLRAIPDSYIDTARTTLHVAYNHTSHGTHVSYGVFGLPGFKTGDATKFGVTRNTAADPDKLDIKDGQIGGAYADLSQADSNWAAWRDQVRAYLDDAANSAINVMMWSWCDITGHSVPNYLSSMQTLIDEYGAGGSKIGTGAGKTRTTPVTFIFMTGHANGNANTGAGHPRDQAKLITDYCTAHGYYCIDYYSIDSHAMDDTYYEDVNDNAVSTAYGGNFYQDWQDAHAKGTDWYENREAPGGAIAYGVHTTQHITANRKAFAFWWVLSRIAGNP